MFLQAVISEVPKNKLPRKCNVYGGENWWPTARDRTLCDHAFGASSAASDRCRVAVRLAVVQAEFSAMGSARPHTSSGWVKMKGRFEHVLHR